MAASGREGFWFASGAVGLHSGGLIMKWIAILVLAALAPGARIVAFADEPPAAGAGAGGPSLAQIQHREQVRMDCINNRRMICGRILKVLPEGLLVDSGYADLMRPPLNKSWLVPGTVVATRAPNLVEGKEENSKAPSLPMVFPGAV